jgi:tripartite-type tricarboxylate transporter receptor subunit TctC
MAMGFLHCRAILRRGVLPEIVALFRRIGKAALAGRNSLGDSSRMGLYRPGLLGIFSAVLLVDASLLLATSLAARAAEPDVSFKGQTVHLYIGFAPGGTYDYFGRLVARHIGRHLPGNPTVIAEQMPGAGSFTAANFLYARAPKDGTALGIVSQTMAIEEALGTPGVQYKAARFNWIGRATAVNEVSFTFRTSKTKTIRDALTDETTMASTGAGSPSETYLKLLNEVASTRFKLVGPYPASNDSMLAMERGEVDGAFTSYATLKFSHQDWLRDHTINILVQYGERAADLPDVPSAVDLATTDEGRQMMAFYVSSEQIGRAFITPPDTPADRVTALRKAYDETVQDPQLLAEIEQSHAEFSPLSGEKLQRLVAATADVSPAIIARVRDVIGIRR